MQTSLIQDSNNHFLSDLDDTTAFQLESMNEIGQVKQNLVNLSQ